MKKNSKNKAFTLIELLTVIAIFAVVTATVMANYQSFGHRTKLKNLAYNIGLSIREAQVSGLTGRNVDVSGGDYYATYGIFFNMSTPKRVVFFKDRPNLGTQYKYDDPSEDVPGLSFNILGANKITGLCIYSAVDANCTPVNQLYVSFKRPQPDANIYSESGGPYPRASIELTSVENNQFYIVVEAAGQISVRATP